MILFLLFINTPSTFCNSTAEESGRLGYSISADYQFLILLTFKGKHSSLEQWNEQDRTLMSDFAVLSQDHQDQASRRDIPQLCWCTPSKGLSRALQIRCRLTKKYKHNDPFVHNASRALLCLCSNHDCSRLNKGLVYRYAREIQILILLSVNQTHQLKHPRSKTIVTQSQPTTLRIICTFKMENGQLRQYRHSNGEPMNGLEVLLTRMPSDVENSLIQHLILPDIKSLRRVSTTLSSSHVLSRIAVQKDYAYAGGLLRCQELRRNGKTCGESEINKQCFADFAERSLQVLYHARPDDPQNVHYCELHPKDKPFAICEIHDFNIRFAAHINDLGITGATSSDMWNSRDGKLEEPDFANRALWP